MRCCRFALILLTLTPMPGWSGPEPVIDWSSLRNPVYEREGWSVKDACMVRHDDRLYLFFSAFFHDRGRERSHVSGVWTRDFETFSEPIFIWEGRGEGWTDICSPNITRLGDRFVLTHNCWGEDHPKGRPNQLVYAETSDFESGTKHRPLAANVTVDGTGRPQRAIDAALTHTGDFFILVWKARQTPMVA